MADLDAQRIATAALAVADERGLNGFTMRASTVSGNTADATAKDSRTADAHGGGLWFLGGSGTNRIENSTIAGNRVTFLDRLLQADRAPATTGPAATDRRT